MPHGGRPAGSVTGRWGAEPSPFAFSMTFRPVLEMRYRHTLESQGDRIGWIAARPYRVKTLLSEWEVRGTHTVCVPNHQWRSATGPDSGHRRGPGELEFVLDSSCIMPYGVETTRSAQAEGSDLKTVARSLWTLHRAVALRSRGEMVHHESFCAQSGGT